MKILFAASEAHPLIKTGGLADVAGALPIALRRLNHDVRVVMPAYRHAVARAGALTLAAELTPTGADEAIRILEGVLPDSDVPVYLIDSPRHFDRPGNPYTTPDGVDWPDNAERFALFARAVVALACDTVGLGWHPEVVHTNDWQCGLIPALLSLEPERPATVFTVHNIAYQGSFDWSTFQSLRLPYDFWSVNGLEFYGKFSFLKGGLYYADWLTTVSPTYAEEICTAAFGYGFEGLLTSRHPTLTGVLNGIDYDIWNPETDPHIAANYSSRRLKDKLANKAALQRTLGLAEDPKVPLIGHIGRLVQQKGVDLLIDALPELLRNRAQVAILGSGDPAAEASLRDAAERHPDHVAIHVGYHEELAHLIEAGADTFVMPSRFEPCGLNQMYSLHYGTPAVVRRTGGLADSVVDTTEDTLAAGTATGFQFDATDPNALIIALQRALIVYYQPKLWQQLMRAGMREDFSWTRSAARYVELYQRAATERDAPTTVPPSLSDAGPTRSGPGTGTG